MPQQKSTRFDAIVVGAGMAGVACAAELVLRGQRPLLICETAEVGANLRSTFIGPNRAFVQHPLWGTLWGGGWWYGLARRMNVPIRIYPSLPWEVCFWPERRFLDIPVCGSASAVADLFCRLSPVPLDAMRAPMERVIQAGLDIPYPELLRMDRVPMFEWLASVGAPDEVATMFLVLMANMNEIPVTHARELSVLGGWGTLRSLMVGEGVLTSIEPDPQEGLCMPLAREIERRGGEVWRGTQVDHIRIEGDRVAGVVLKDGRESHSDTVAVAAGNPRIPALFRQLPPEIEEPLHYSGQFVNQEFTLFTLLDGSVIPRSREKITTLVKPDASNLQLNWTLHSFPWTTEPGRQFLLSQRMFHGSEAEEAGGREAILADMQATNELLYPGFRDAIVATATTTHRHHWSIPLLAGPKLPRRSTSVHGLWFVGDASMPVGGLFVDGAASAGMLGAQAITCDRA